MTQDKAPKWAEAKADKLLGVGWGKEMQGIRQTMLRSIALALSQAYERGQESMRERAAKLVEEGYDREVAKPWSANGASKNDLCSHGMAVYQDCEQCAVAAIRSLPIEQDGGE